MSAAYPFETESERTARLARELRASTLIDGLWESEEEKAACMARLAEADAKKARVLVRDGGRLHTVTLKATIGPGDTPEPVVTIMMPDED